MGRAPRHPTIWHLWCGSRPTAGLPTAPSDHPPELSLVGLLEEPRWRRRGFFFRECPSFGPPLPYQRCDAGTPSAFNSLYVTSEILMLWTPNPVRTSAHHTRVCTQFGDSA